MFFFFFLLPFFAIFFFEVALQICRLFSLPRVLDMIYLSVFDMCAALKQSVWDRVLVSFVIDRFWVRFGS